MTDTKGIGTLTLKALKEAVAGDAVALRCVNELVPAGGPSDKVFPPTYEGGKYALEKRLVDGQRVQCVLLDSVASQANRIELALLRACRTKLVSLPLIEVDYAAKGLPDVGRVSTLDAPHRIADAILRDSIDKSGTKFRDTEVGRSFSDASVANATELFGWCPTALLFGMWDSTGPKGGQGAKFARCLVSEIVGIDVEVGVRTSSRIDPLQIQRAAGELFEAAAGGWTLDTKKARTEKGKPAKLGKDGKPSEANHGNVTPSITEGAGGVTLSRAMQTTTLSLAGLRRLQFPAAQGASEERNAAARTVLAALGLYGSSLARDAGLDLRSRCLLVPARPPVWEVLAATGGVALQFSAVTKDLLVMLQQAVAAARATHLPWHEEGCTLTPLDDVVTLVKKSRELAASGATEAQ